MGAGESASTWFTHRPGKSVLAIHWALSQGRGAGPMDPLQVGLSTSCLGFLTAWWVGFQEQVSQEMEMEGHNIFKTWYPEVTWQDLLPQYSLDWGSHKVPCFREDTS